MRINNIIIIILSLFIIAYTGCRKSIEWNDHYNLQSGISEKNKILEEMEKIPEISLFTDEVKKMDSLNTILGFNTLFTVFAPTNEEFKNISSEILTDDYLLTRFIAYHFVVAKLKKNELLPGDLLALNGKFHNISYDTNKNILLDNTGKILQHDIITKNGFIHVIDKPLIPVNNLYEHFYLNDEVKTVYNSINALTYYEFDIENSEKLSVDEEGNVIYDSVLIERNPFLDSDIFYDFDYLIDGKKFNGININSEYSQFTMVVPLNIKEKLNNANQNSSLNSSIPDYILVEPYLYHMIFENEYSKEQLIAHMLADDDPFKIWVDFANLLENNFVEEISLSNGTIYMVDNFEYDLEYLIDSILIDNTDDLLKASDISDNIDTIVIEQGAVKTYITDKDDTLNVNYEEKYGEWIEFELNETFYPVNYTFYVSSRGYASGTFTIEVDGKSISDFPFYLAPPSGDQYTYWEIGPIHFKEVKESVAVRFIYKQTHDGDNKNEQFLWVDGFKFKPILN